MPVKSDNSFRYCIEHEYMDLVYIDNVHLHYSGDSYMDPEQCLGPFAFCPPPETTEEYWQNLLESEEVNA